MPKRKSSRAAVRTTPQPKERSFIPAVFTDDYGRDRALTVASAKAFSKKKLDAASRALERRANLAMDKAIRDGDRETARAIRRLRKLEREAERSIARFFRRRIRTAIPLTRKIKHAKPKARQQIWPSSSRALPKYDGPIRDRFNRRGVFFRARYYSSRTAKPGVSKRVTIYIYKGAALDENGEPLVRMNVGASIEEAVCGFDHLEQVNRSAQKNAKLLNHAVLAMDYRWTPEQMLEVGERWAEERFDRYGLPYVVSLHEPPPEGDERNWHLHVIWSWRPMERVGDHEWLVGESLRSELDGAQGMWVLRERFAALMTEMSFEAGNADVYTALSYAARGLPVETQIHLDEGRTRRARAGELVEANEENHDRVVRSKAALADDALRREDARLARLQALERRVAARFAKAIAASSVPQIFVRPAAITATLKRVRSHALRLTKRILVSAPPPSYAHAHAKAVRSLRILGEGREALAAGKFANLRISDRPIRTPRPAPPVTALFASATVAPRIPSVRPFARPVSVTSAPLNFRSASISLPAKHISKLDRLRRTEIPSLAKVLPACMPGPTLRLAISSFNVPQALGSLPPSHPLQKGISVSAESQTPHLPFLRSFKLPLVATVLPKMQHVPAVSVATRFNCESADISTWRFDRHRLRAAMDEATIAQLEHILAKATKAISPRSGDQKAAVTKSDRSTAEAASKVTQSAPEHLFDLLVERRHRLVRDKKGRLKVPETLVESTGLTKEQLYAIPIQQQLEQEAKVQRAELTSIASFLAPDPQKRLIKWRTSWRLNPDAPEALRVMAFKWRDEPEVQRAFQGLAQMPPIDEADTIALDARCKSFLNLVFGHSDDVGVPDRRTDNKLTAWPINCGGGIGE